MILWRRKTKKKKRKEKEKKGLSRRSFFVPEKNVRFEIPLSFHLAFFNWRTATGRKKWLPFFRRRAERELPPELIEKERFRGKRRKIGGTVKEGEEGTESSLAKRTGSNWKGDVGRNIGIYVYRRRNSIRNRNWLGNQGKIAFPFPRPLFHSILFLGARKWGWSKARRISLGNGKRLRKIGKWETQGKSGEFREQWENRKVRAGKWEIGKRKWETERREVKID